MPKNMGTADRAIRVILAAIFLVLALAGSVHGALAWVLVVLAVVFLVTSLVGTCPLYLLLGIDTKKKS